MTRIHALRRGLSSTLLWAAGVLLVIMTVLVVIQIITRYAINQPTAWTEELVRYALIWTSFLAASYAFIERRHMALSFLRDRLPPPARRGVTIAVDVLVLLFAVLVLGVGGTMLALNSIGDLSALLGISRGAVYAIVPISGLAIALAQVVVLLDRDEGPTGAAQPGADAPEARTTGGKGEDR